MQVVGSIEWVTGVTWPEPFATCARIMSITQLNLPDVIPLGCAIKNITFYDQLLSATLVPIAVIVLLNLASFEVIHFLPECCVPWKSQWCDRQARNVLRPWFRCCYKLDANRNNPFTVRGPQLISRGTAIKWTQLIAFCVLPSTSLVLFRVFDCKEFPDGTSWLTAQVDASCDSPTYHAWLAYTVIFLFVYPCGIPLAFYLSLRRKRAEILELDRTKTCPRNLKKYEFLYIDYKNEYCKTTPNP
jgi:hypothetical protein